MSMKNLLASILILILLTACIPSEIQGGSVTETAAQPEAGTASPETITLTVVYTNDEHGWMAGEEEGQGAAELAGLWATEFSESDVVLPISGGDNWTGPAISTWFQGESMVDVMNAMGYVASTIGNHEFDFETSGLAARSEQANFPYLGANIRYKANGEIPSDLGIQPFTVIDVAGVQIGIIGLANQETPMVTNPLYVAELDFTHYEAALREYLPQVQATGTDLVLAPTHICESELSQLAQEVKDLGIALFGGGHCHEQFAEKEESAILLGGGSNLRGYAFATFEVETASGAYELVDYGTEENFGGAPQPQVAEIVAHWQELADTELNTPIGYLENEIPQQSDEMAALIVETWLWAYPTADVAITNWGGMRDRLPAGEVTYASIISVMPFENVLMDVSLTGAELAKVLASGDYLPAIGGVTFDGLAWVLTESEEPIDPEATYNLLTTDFLYAGGDNYRIAEFDPEAYNTAINWRQPVIDWILAQESSAEKPLDASIERLLK
jgi:5'-nucleotidase/UDP-sugar diphosphatase